MILADVLKIVFLILGALIVVISYWLAAIALVPGTVNGTRLAYTTRPGRITITGLLIGLPLVVLGAALVNGAPHPGLKLLGAGIASLPILLGLVGSAGLSECVGHGLMHGDDAHNPWRRSLRGAVVLALTFLLPVIGWFIVLPLTVFSGFGALVFATRREPITQLAVVGGTA